MISLQLNPFPVEQEVHQEAVVAQWGFKPSFLIKENCGQPKSELCQIPLYC